MYKETYINSHIHRYLIHVHRYLCTHVPMYISVGVCRLYVCVREGTSAPNRGITIKSIALSYCYYCYCLTKNEWNQLHMLESSQLTLIFPHSTSKDCADITLKYFHRNKYGKQQKIPTTNYVLCIFHVNSFTLCFLLFFLQFLVLHDSRLSSYTARLTKHMNEIY